MAKPKIKSDGRTITVRVPISMRKRGGRVLRLTLLAPDIVEAIVGGRQSPGIKLPVLMKRISTRWSDQRVTLGS